MNNKDVVLLAYISIAYSNSIKENKQLERELKNLSDCDPRYKQHEKTVRDFGKKYIVEKHKKTFMFDIVNYSIQKQSRLLKKKMMKKILKSPRIYPQGFKTLFLDQVNKSMKFKKITCVIMRNIRKLANLPEVCCWVIFKYLNLQDLVNLKECLKPHVRV